MNSITSWISSKALKIAENQIENLFDSSPNFETFVSNEISAISEKLDVIIQAPFKQAIMHLREGNIDKCQEKLVEAISLNETDLPALLLYCLLLRLRKQYTLAFEYYIDVLNKFGARADLVPDSVVKLYQQAYEELSVPVGEKPSLELKEGDDYYPVRTFYWIGGIAVLWERRMPKKSLMDQIFYSVAQLFPGSENKVISVHDWSGERILYLDSKDLNIETVTASYIVISMNYDYLVYRSKDGSKLPVKLDGDKYNTLFKSSNTGFNICQACEWNDVEKYTFINTKTRKKLYSFDSTEIVHRQVSRYSTGNVEEVTHHEGGKLLISIERK